METTEIVACRIVPLPRRIIPLPEIVATELTRHITLHARGHGDHLFAKRNDEPMSADYCRRRILYPAVPRSGLVLKTYGHLMPDGDDRTRVAVDAAWSTSL